MKYKSLFFENNSKDGCFQGNFECRLCEGSNFWNEGGRKLSPYARMKREWVKGEKFQRKTQKK